MNPAEIVEIAGTGARLTRLGYGGAPIGNFAGVVADADAEQALAAAWDAGIRYFDTAPWYGIGLSEHRVGTFLRSKPREQFTLSTKVGRILRPWGKSKGPRINRGPWIEPLDFEVRFDYSYDGVIRSYEDSLQRLGLADIDILLVHDLDRGYHESDAAYTAARSQLFSGGCQALRDLRADGKIRAIGAGVNGPGTITDMLEAFAVDMFLVAGPYTLLDQAIIDGELRRCEESGIAVVIGAAFRYGILATGTRGYRPDGPVPLSSDELDRVARLEVLCERFDVVLPSAAIQFPFGHPSVASVLFGAVDGPKVESTVSLFERPIPQEFWDAVKAEGLIAATAPIPRTTS